MPSHRTTAVLACALALMMAPSVSAAQTGSDQAMPSRSAAQDAIACYWKHRARAERMLRAAISRTQSLPDWRWEVAGK